MTPVKAKRPRVPKDSFKAFAFLVGQCATGLTKELLRQGKDGTQARNIVIGCFLAMAAGESCRIAREEGRKPNPSKWRKATKDAFDRAVKRTAP